MRVGVLADIHSNLVALESVLEDIPSVDAFVCAGDVVGYNPWPAECVDALRGETDAAGLDTVPPPFADGVPTVEGNHDRMVTSGRTFRGNHMARAGVQHTESELDENQLAWLQGLPRERTLYDGRLKIVHGHPRDPDRYTYPRDFSPRLLEDEDVLVMGHTHVQHYEQYSEGVVMNPGSVGQPRDEDPRAAYAVLDLDSLAVEEYRVEYDVDRVQEAIDAAGLPRRTGTRLARGR